MKIFKDSVFAFVFSVMSTYYLVARFLDGENLFQMR